MTRRPYRLITVAVETEGFSSSSYTVQATGTHLSPEHTLVDGFPVLVEISSQMTEQGSIQRRPSGRIWGWSVIRRELDPTLIGVLFLESCRKGDDRVSQPYRQERCIGDVENRNRLVGMVGPWGEQDHFDV